MSHTQSIAQIITEGSRIKMVYRRADGEIAERVVDVERVWTGKGGETVFTGFCHRRQERRTFALAHVLWAMVDDGMPLRSFTACAMLEASTARLMRAHRDAVLRSERYATSSDRLVGWD
jgi:hypothetical protein